MTAGRATTTTSWRASLALECPALEAERTVAVEPWADVALRRDLLAAQWAGRRVPYDPVRARAETPGHLGSEQDIEAVRGFDLRVRQGHPHDPGDRIPPHLELVRAEQGLSLIHISEPTRRTPISYAVF